MPAEKKLLKKTTLSSSSLEIWARLVRRAVRRAQQMRRFRRWSLDGTPIFFANSFPKSGTHLLTQVLESLPSLGPAVLSGLPAVVMFQGDSGALRSEARVINDLLRLCPGDISYGHVHAFPGAVEILSRPGWATYFILRDPRDVVVSHVHYITSMEARHVHHQYFTKVLPDFPSRLRTSIQGMTDDQVLLPNVCERFAPFLGWVNQARVLSLRFEDFITDQHNTLGRIIDHATGAGFPLNTSRDRAIECMQAHINPKNSPTFRSGKAGGWREQFSVENKQLFKDIAGDLLIQLGYESGYDW